ncbi:hypothetical protein L4D76_09775 [Photobacterium sagamiensis]|uniref:hypothetical protein n=1 Tax=Photobacterium sagamiensis TaxID=2910241 RepID=UPI003D11AACB
MKIVKLQVKQGLEKKEVFKNALGTGLDKKKVSKYLANFPDKDLSGKYNRANNILIALYSVMSLFGIIVTIGLVSDLPTIAIAGLLIFGILFPGFIIYCIHKKYATGYLILSFILFQGIIDSLKDLETDPTGVWIGVSISLLLLAYVVILKKKLFPYQNFLNFRKNEDGVYIYSKDMTSQGSQTH